MQDRVLEAVQRLAPVAEQADLDGADGARLGAAPGERRLRDRRASRPSGAANVRLRIALDAPRHAIDEALATSSCADPLGVA